MKGLQDPENAIVGHLQAEPLPEVTTCRMRRDIHVHMHIHIGCVRLCARARVCVCVLMYLFYLHHIYFSHTSVHVVIHALRFT